MADKDKAEREAHEKKAECDNALAKNGQLMAKLSQAHAEQGKISGTKLTTPSYNSHKYRSLQ